MRKALRLVALGLAGGLLVAPPAFADLKLTMENGRVTLVAKDVTVRQILTEWARVGQTKIINLERIPGGPVSLELNNVPEADALDVLLRSVAGYLAAPRPVDAANLSHFDRIVVMPSSVAARPAPTPAPSQPSRPAYSPPPLPQFGPPEPVEEPEDDDPEPIVPSTGPGRGPIFNTPQPPQVVNPATGTSGAPGDPYGGGRSPGPRGAVGQPDGEPPASSQPSMPGGFPQAPSVPSGPGVPVPGMIVQPPPAPGAQPGPTGRGGGPGGA